MTTNTEYVKMMAAKFPDGRADITWGELLDLIERLDPRTPQQIAWDADDAETSATLESVRP